MVTRRQSEAPPRHSASPDRGSPGRVQRTDDRNRPDQHKDTQIYPRLFTNGSRRTDSSTYREANLDAEPDRNRHSTDGCSYRYTHTYLHIHTNSDTYADTSHGDRAA